MSKSSKISSIERQSNIMFWAIVVFGVFMTMGLGLFLIVGVPEDKQKIANMRKIQTALWRYESVNGYLPPGKKNRHCGTFVDLNMREYLEDYLPGFHWDKEIDYFYGVNSIQKPTEYLLGVHLSSSDHSVLDDDIDDGDIKSWQYCHCYDEVDYRIEGPDHIAHYCIAS